MKLKDQKWNWKTRNEVERMNMKLFAFFLKLKREFKEAINFVAKLKDHSLIWMKKVCIWPGKPIIIMYLMIMMIFTMKMMIMNND